MYFMYKLYLFKETYTDEIQVIPFSFSFSVIANNTGIMFLFTYLSMLLKLFSLVKFIKATYVFISLEWGTHSKEMKLKTCKYSAFLLAKNSALFYVLVGSLRNFQGNCKGRFRMLVTSLVDFTVCYK